MVLLDLKLLIPFVSSLAVSVLIIPAVRWFSIRTKHVSAPRQERWHQKPTPTLGGIGIFCAFLIALGLIYATRLDVTFLRTYWSILAGIGIMFFVGLVDDLKHISPPVKLIFQLIVAMLVIFFGGYTINFFRWPIANIILTFLWLVGITNAFNLLDNMDGLAAGIALITAGFLAVFFLRSSHVDLLYITLALAGSLVGFWIFNFPPARIFMGDSGSMVIGFALASLAVARRTQASNIFAIVGVPIMVFLLPIVDTALVSITRILRGQSPAVGGTDHTSHRLVAFGLSERQAVLVLYAIAFISGLVSIGIEALDYDLSLIFVPLLLITLSLFVAYLSRMKVVSSASSPGSGITRWMVNLTYKRRLFELLFDLLLIGISYYLAFWTRFGMDMTRDSVKLFLASWPVAFAVTYACFFLLGIYRGVWRYIGITDMIRYVLAALLSGGLSWLLIRIIYPAQSYSGEVYLLYILFLLIGLSGSRSSFLFLDRLYTRQFTGADQVNVILYGAGDAGEIALRWLLRNPTIGYCVVGFIDDDSLKWGSNIHGVSILGDSSKLTQLMHEKEIKGVIATSESLLQTPNGEKLLADCKDKGVWVRILRLEFELIR